MPLSETAAGVGLKLAYTPALLAEIEGAIDAAMRAATPEQKADYGLWLRQHLDAVKEQLQKDAAGADPTNTPADLARGAAGETLVILAADNPVAE